MRMHLPAVIHGLLFIKVVMTRNVSPDGSDEECMFDVMDEETLQKPWKAPEKPTVVRKVLSDIQKFADRDYVKTALGDIPLIVSTGNKLDEKLQGVNGGIVPNPSKMNLSDWVPASAAGKASPYVFNLCTGICITRVSQLPGFDTIREWPDHLKLFFGIGQDSAEGDRGTSMHTHEDSDAWAFQLVGSKTWVVSHKDNAEHDLSASESWQKRQRRKFPVQKCIQHPGDVIFVPAKWWHGTTASGWQVAWVNQPNKKSVQLKHPLGMATITGNTSAIDASQISSKEEKRIRAMAMESGHVEVLRHFKPKPLDKLYGSICESGNTDVIDFNLEHGVSKGVVDSFAQCAAEYGFVDVMHLAVQKGGANPCQAPDHFNSAAKAGHVSMVEYLLKKGCKKKWLSAENKRIVKTSKAPVHQVIAKLLGTKKGKARATV